MNKFITKIVGAALGLTLAIGVGVAVGANQGESREVNAEETTLASWSVTSNGYTIEYTSGLTENNNLKSGGSGNTFKTDNSTSQEYYAKLTSNLKATFSEASSRQLTFKTKLGGGTGGKTLSSDIYVSYLDSSGSVIDASTKSITSTITTNTGDDYSVLMGISTSDVYGIKIYHNKTASYNVRFYSFSLSYDNTPAINIDQSDQTINVGDNDVQLTVTKLNDGGASVSWASSDATKATVSSSGVVHALAAGATTITASMTVDQKLYSDSITVTVTNISYKRYVRITSTAELVSGARYLILNEDEDKAFDSSLATLDANNNNVSVNITNSKARASSAISFLITSKQGGYSIKTSTNKYIGNTSDANALKTSSSDDYVNTIGFDSTDGYANISSAGTFLRFNANVDSKRFRYIKSGTYTQQATVYLYKEMSATDYAKSFLTAGLNTTKQTCASSVTAWNNLKAEFNDLDSTIKTTFANATHAAPSTYDDSNDFTVAHCVARYDQAIKVNGLELCPDFMGREAAGQLALGSVGGISLDTKSNNSTTLLVIILVSSISLVAVSGYFVIRRRREN